MKTLLLCTLTVMILALACLGQSSGAPAPGHARDATITRPPSGTYIEGWNIVGNGMTDIIASESVIDVTPFYQALGTGDICSAIQNALATSPASQTIDARGINGNVTCGVSPFNGYLTSLTGRLLLGGVTITTTVQWTMPNTYFWIEGITSASGSAKGTVIKAASTFSCSNGTGAQSMLKGCPLVFIAGTGANGDSFNSGVRNLELDCNTLSTCIGAGSVNVQEQGGLDTVTLTNQKNVCVDFDAAEKSGTGVGISNAVIRNVDCVMSTSSTSSSIGLYVNAVDGPAEISNISVTEPTGSANIAECLDLDGARGAIVNYVHCEHAVYGERIGDSNAVTGANIRGLTSGNSIGTYGVYIGNSGDTDIEVEDVELNASTKPALRDDVNGITISPSSLVSYAMTSSGGTVITTDKATPTALAQETLLGVPFTTLGSQANGTILYCTNCATGTTPCATSGGTGALAVKQNGAWSCK
jgi:hypothetical protein